MCGFARIFLVFAGNKQYERKLKKWNSSPLIERTTLQVKQQYTNELIHTKQQCK